MRNTCVMWTCIALASAIVGRDANAFGHQAARPAGSAGSAGKAPSAKPPNKNSSSKGDKAVSTPPSGIRGTPSVREPAKAVSSRLQPEPTLVESLGLSMHLPRDATFAQDAQSATPAFVMDDAHDPPRYRCRISILIPSELDADCASLVTDHLHAMQDRGQKPTVLSNELLPCGERDGRLFYASVPLDASTTAITGWYLVQLAPSQFLVCSVVSSALDFPPVKQTLRDFFASWNFADRDAIAVRHVERLKRGAECVELLDGAALRAASSPAERWYRLVRNAPDGTPTELGYMVMSSRPGKRGEVDTDRDPQKFTTLEAEDGLLLDLRSRTVLSAKDAAFTDTAARFWTSWDRQTEAWSAIATDRIGPKTRSFAETGLRAPPTALQPVPILRVMTTNARTPSGTELEWEPDPRYYLSQCERWHLGKLLPRDGSFTGDFALAIYDARLAQLPIVQCSWAREGDRWVLTSQPARDQPLERAWYDEDGVLVKRIDADGTTTEAVTLDRLKSLWKAAGLPMR